MLYCTGAYVQTLLWSIVLNTVNSPIDLTVASTTLSHKCLWDGPHIVQHHHASVQPTTHPQAMILLAHNEVALIMQRHEKKMQCHLAKIVSQDTVMPGTN